MITSGTGRLVLMLTSVAFLAACEEGTKPKFFDKPLFQKKEATATDETPVATVTQSVTLVERDVEAPDVFQNTGSALWDGRPSLGGVWVAHPDVVDPERVIIRNSKNGKFVIGALFRRERDNPGPKTQVSSDAASALGMLAGAPTELNVTALRREEAPVELAASEPLLDTPDVITGPEIVESTLDPVATAAASAITAAEVKAGTKPPKPVKPVAAAPAPTAPKATSNAAKSQLKKPYLQIGIFSVQANAKRAVSTLKKAGVVSSIKKSSSSGKTFWRVVVGPALSTAERDGVLKSVKGAGFKDAYAVTN